MNAVHAAPVSTDRTRSPLRTAVTVFVAVLAALVATAALMIVLFAPTSGDPVPVQASNAAAQLAFDCPDGADACIQPVTTRHRIPRA